MEGNNHYIVVENGFITDGFSDAFRQPQGNEIRIKENAGRQFEFNGITNPQLKDFDGYSLYKFFQNEILEATKEEQPQYAAVETQKAREAFKIDRTSAVEKITVEISGKLFDGDEISQGRMARAVLVMDDIETTGWVLSGELITTEVTKAELLAAIKAAGIVQTSLWTQ